MAGRLIKFTQHFTNSATLSWWGGYFHPLTSLIFHSDTQLGKSCFLKVTSQQFWTAANKFSIWIFSEFSNVRLSFPENVGRHSLNAKIVLMGTECPVRIMYFICNISDLKHVYHISSKHETAEGGNQAIRIKRFTESVFLPVRKLAGVGANKGKVRRSGFVFIPLRCGTKWRAGCFCCLFIFPVCRDSTDV